MVKNQTSQGSLVPALFAGIAGILCVFIVPLITMRAMDTIISGALIKIEASGNPLLVSAPKIVISFFPVWGGLSTAAGIALIFVAWAIYQGKSWA
ncbi:MAG: hypothetical protein GWN30_19870, partial [Gammaproteobacteria bacterium]|nr:hypothetical protein [Gammaproteobacteria bacterium]